MSKKTFKVGITIESENPEQAKKLGGLVQNTLNKVEHDDIVTLLEKVAKNPKIVKKALRFV